jgi:phenylalanyl-tRNA synthetase beta chain
VTGREIIVRRAGDGERVITLDGQERALDADVLVIADAEKPSAVGGLMGSQWSEVSDETTTVLLECANFDGPNIQSSSTRLELRTEGSTRWEKGLDPHLVPRALALASQLMVEVTGARLVPGRRPARAAARAGGGAAAAGAAGAADRGAVRAGADRPCADPARL